MELVNLIAESQDLDVDKKSYPTTSDVYRMAWDIELCLADLHVASGAQKITISVIESQQHTT
jgi:hypothetical protein